MIAAPEQAAEGLAGSVDPLLIGVRHHSSALAAAVPALLEAFAPDRVLIELPTEFAAWLPWLGHPDARAPLALGAVSGSEVGFYPFADFSPELAAIRWALARSVPVEPFDLPLRSRAEEDGDSPGGSAQPGVVRHLLAAEEALDGEELWDRLVEARCAGASPEAARRAALLYGWSLRSDTPAARRSDLARERFMRSELHRVRREGARRVAVVIGAYHAAALVDPALDPLPRLEGDPAPPTGAEVVTSLLPYAFEQLDSRSGYPAGIRDPLWHQRAFEAARDGREPGGVARDVLVEVCRAVRRERHVAGTPDATEALRMARGLAALRDLSAPGRREVLEAATSALARGEVLGRGRVLARALERVLVGRERGRLAAGTPRSGLAPHVEDLLAALRLPGPRDEVPREPTRLDPLRSETDRRRHVALCRLEAAGVSYGQLQADEDALGAVWRVGWTAATDATLAAASLRGVTLEMAATGALRAREQALDAEDKLGAAARLELLAAAAACGLPDRVRAGVRALRAEVVDEAGLPELVTAIRLVERLSAGHIPGSPVDGTRRVGAEPGAVPTLDVSDLDLGGARDALIAAAVRAVEGLQGSEAAEDVQAVVELARVFELRPDGDADGPPGLGDGRLLWALARMTEDGSPRMQGAAAGARLLLGAEGSPALGERVASWVDACAGASSRVALAGRLQGTLLAVGPLLEGDPALVEPLLGRVAALDDEGFLRRLPALREGFDVLSPAARERLLHAVAARVGEEDRPDATFELPPELLARFAAADAEARRALERLGLVPVPAATAPAAEVRPVRAIPESRGALRSTDRWRLVLGRQRDRLPPSATRYARALDELYGRGRGEGSREDGSGGGTDAPYPSVREWGQDLGELFGGSVREEVLGRAAERGDRNAIGELDPEQVRPSIELLEAVLSLKGGMSEAQLEGLRRLVARVVDQLVAALAVRVQPALVGLSIPRPTRRRTDRLDLRRTVAANLHTARASEGGFGIAPERLIFRTRARRSMDWRVVLVVDTSGSMDANIVHAAMMSAILSRLPAVSVHFLAFSTQVVDLTDRVDDPLALLLEVEVGGGTDIGKALRYARQLVTAPTRTLLVLVSDFEEGGPVGRMLGEVRALVESGVRALGLAALDEEAKPTYNAAIAERLVAAGMPVAALTPLELARWVGEQIRGGA